MKIIYKESLRVVSLGCVLIPLSEEEQFSPICFQSSRKLYAQVVCPWPFMLRETWSSHCRSQFNNVPFNRGTIACCINRKKFSFRTLFCYAPWTSAIYTNLLSQHIVLSYFYFIWFSVRRAGALRFFINPLRIVDPAMLSQITEPFLYTFSAWPVYLFI